MSVVILGSEGSMGQRYQAILKWLRVPHSCIDVHSTKKQIAEAYAKALGVVIATPTESHLELIDEVTRLKIPILCEKPLSKSLSELELIKGFVEGEKVNLTMMLQYEMLDPSSSGASYYNYFRHGKDGLAWDCLQVIGLARGPFEIAEDSPVWRCRLNGQWLNSASMDRAYVEFVRKWLERPGQDINRLIDMHHKVMDFKSAKGY